jgi:hypothetical protein
MRVAGLWIAEFGKGERQLSTNDHMVLLGLAVASGKKVPQQDNHNQPHKGKQAEPDTGFINFDVIILQIDR